MTSPWPILFRAERRRIPLEVKPINGGERLSEQEPNVGGGLRSVLNLLFPAPKSHQPEVLKAPTCQHLQPTNAGLQGAASDTAALPFASDPSSSISRRHPLADPDCWVVML